jgi:hypothetical protein
LGTRLLKSASTSVSRPDLTFIFRFGVFGLDLSGAADFFADADFSHSPVNFAEMSQEVLAIAEAATDTWFAILACPTMTCALAATETGLRLIMTSAGNGLGITPITTRFGNTSFTFDEGTLTVLTGTLMYNL